MLVRAEAVLTELEEKDGHCGPVSGDAKLSAQIENAASQIMMINEERYASSDLLRLAQEIRDCAAKLKE